jgi:hypothetical protein
MGTAGELREHVTPCYRAAEDAPWFHFLHGNVPGHQIDFLYRPEVPQGPLCRQHYSHLARLMDCIEPHSSAGYAFAIGNLSRDDTQHEPGHGGVALIIGLRVRGTTDHAGRPDPPFAHAVATIDRALDAPTLFESAMAFHRRVLGDAASADWYRSYVRSAADAPAETERILAGYVASFADLPRPAPSTLGLAWTAGGVRQAGRVVFVYQDDAPFEVLAGAAARIAAVLYRSDVRWSAISNGREADLSNGITVRLLPRSAVGPGDSAATLHALEELPEDDERIARELFGARPVPRTEPPAPRWEERYATGPSEEEIDVTLEAPVSAPARPSSSDEPRRYEAGAPAEIPPTRESPPERSPRRWKVFAIAAMGSAIAVATVCAFLAIHQPTPATTQLDGAPAATTAPVTASQLGTAAPPAVPPAQSSATSAPAVSAKKQLPAQRILVRRPRSAPSAPAPVDADPPAPQDPTLIYHPIP